MLTSIEKKYIRILAWFHLAIGCICIPLAALLALTYNHVPRIHLIDFVNYYAAATIVRHNPHQLYEFSAYTDLYRGISAAAAEHYKNSYFIFIAPPLTALLLYPLSYLNYDYALLVFCLINLLTCLLLAQRIGTLAEIMSLGKLAFFFRSCVFGLATSFIIISKGQTTLIICLFFVNLLIALSKQKKKETAFWLGLLLELRPQLFIPFLLYLAGTQRWRIIIYVLGWSLLYAILCMLFIDTQVWFDYMHMMMQYRNVSDGLQHYTSALITLSGMLSYWLGDTNPYLVTVNSCAYLLLCLLSLKWTLFTGKLPDILSVALLSPAILLFSLYLQAHDIILLLPVAIILTNMLLERRQARWMWACYFPASYTIGLFNIEWEARMVLMLFCGISAYLVSHKDVHA